MRQSLDEPLRPALLATDAVAGRALVEEYLRRPAALRYQAEFVLGCLDQRAKNYAAAKAHFEQALAQAPDYHAPWHFLGFANYYLGEVQAARHAFEEHLESSPEEGESWFGLGLADLDLGRVADAERDFRKSIECNEALRAADPAQRSRAREISKARVRLSDVLVAQADLAGAREQLEQASRLWPSQVETWFKLSQVLERLGDAAAAEQARQTYLQLKAGQPASPGEDS